MFKIKEPLWLVIVAAVMLVMGDGFIWDGAFAESDAHSRCLSSNVHGAKGILACNVAIKKEPKDGELWNARGFEWIGQGDYDRAIDDFNEAIALNSEHAEAYYNRGRARELKKDFRGALDDFNRFIELEPSDADGPKARNRVRAELNSEPATNSKRDEEKPYSLDQKRGLSGEGGIETAEPSPGVRKNDHVITSAQDAVIINKRLGDLGAQIATLTKVVGEQSEIQKNASIEVRGSVEQTITALNSRIKQLKSEYDVKDEEFSRYLTSVRPNDRDFYLTARRASESYPKIPYYIPGTKEIGEFWIEPTVTDNGQLLFGFKFVDTEASIEKVRGNIDMSGPEIEEVQNALLKLHEWSEKAHHENVRSYEKRIVCFPEKDCPPDGERIDGKSSTEIRFIVYEDGSTAGRIQRNKGLFVEGYNVSIDSALMLQAYLNHVIKAANKEYTSGRRTKKELDEMFK